MRFAKLQLPIYISSFVALCILSKFKNFWFKYVSIEPGTHMLLMQWVKRPGDKTCFEMTTQRFYTVHASFTFSILQNYEIVVET